ncbi:MAG: hypothetical protein AB8G99_17080 [Planctomycetaceae bacterium]
MWCVTCKADVAAQVSAETGRVSCASCGAELAQAEAIRERTKDAREILERWSSKSMLDPYGPLPVSSQRLSDLPELEEAPVPPAPRLKPSQTHQRENAPSKEVRSMTSPGHQSEEERPRATRPVKTSKRSIRVDRPASVHDVTDTSAETTRLRSQRRPVSRYIDGPHAKELSGPHFEMAPPKQSSWAVTTGQWLAYTGVLGLTIGTAVVVGGYFGGYSNYTPTGWLIVTVGQMLLFLGVINMVSGGMEQSNNEVSHRIEVLGERLLRMEASTHEALRGPRIPASRYAEGEVAESETSRSQSHVES